MKPPVKFDWCHHKNDYFGSTADNVIFSADEGVMLGDACILIERTTVRQHCRVAI